MPKIKYPYEYDPEKRRVAKAYSRERMISRVINGIAVPLAFFAVFYFAGLSVALEGVTGSSFPGMLLYIFVFLTALSLVQFPFRFYSAFVREHKYRLSRHTARSWLRDYAKSLFIMYLFNLPIIFGLYIILPLQFWWAYAGAAYFFLSVFLRAIIPVFILPMFYRLEPYRNRRHLKTLIGMLRKSGVTDVEGVYVADESRKSVKANALFSGLGRTKKIVLFDTLVNSFTEDEVETVIGHEAGHYVNKDVWRDIGLETALIFPKLLLIDFILQGGRASITSLPLIFMIFTLAELLLMPVITGYSRHMEAEADIFALEMCRKPDAQISAEKRLADMGLGDHEPNPLIEFVFHTHPSTKKRIDICSDWKKSRKKSRKL